MKYTDAFREHFSGRQFSAGDAKRFLGEKGASQQYTKLSLHNLIKGGKLHRIRKGIYTFNKGDSSIWAAFSPAYHGLQEALSIHGMWGQATNQVIVTPKKVRSGERIVMGRKVIVRRISRKMFFGHAMVNYGGEWINVSDPEKTMVDFVYFREPIDKKALKALLRKIDRKKLLQYLKMVNKATRKKVLAVM